MLKVREKIDTTWETLKTKKNITKLQEKQQRTRTKVKVKVLVLIIWFNKNCCHDNEKEVWVGT